MRDGNGGGKEYRVKVEPANWYEVGGNEFDDEVEKNQKMSKSKKSFKSKKTIESSDFLIPKAKLAFIKLRQAFLKAPIYYHFDSKRHIRIEIDVSKYAMDRVFSQLTLYDLCQWHPVAFFSQKIIPAKPMYETHNSELLVIVEAFKT